MRSIEEHDAYLRERFESGRVLTKMIAIKLESVGLRKNDDEGFTYWEDNDYISITVFNMKTLKAVLRKASQVIGKYKIVGVYGDHTGNIAASYSFEACPTFHLRLEMPPDEFPIDKFSPGCVVHPVIKTDYVVSCPTKVES